MSSTIGVWHAPTLIHLWPMRQFGELEPAVAFGMLMCVLMIRATSIQKICMCTHSMPRSSVPEERDTLPPKKHENDFYFFGRESLSGNM